VTTEFRLRQVLHLLAPSLLGVKNRRRALERGDVLKLALFTLVTVLFCTGIFAGFNRMLAYIGRFGEFTTPLTLQVLGTISMFLVTVVLTSSIVTALSTQFLSQDLALLVSSPVPLPALYSARFILTVLQSSWMVLVFSLPMYAAFAAASDGPFTFAGAVLLVLPPLMVIPAALGGMITTLLMALFPARRVREILMILGTLFVVLLVFVVRMQRPERLLNPRSIYDVTAFFATFKAPSAPLLPSTWATDVLSAGLTGGRLPWLPLGLLWSTAAALTILGCWQARTLFLRGYSRAQESRPARFSSLPLLDAVLEKLTRPLGLRFRSILLKDLRTFLRDTTQWSQLLLLLALVVIYLYNFSVIPKNFAFGTFFIQNLVSFLNLGLAGFVLSAVAVRFVFTSVSSEGPAFWIIRSSPLPLRTFLWSKFWTALPPLLVLSQILTLVSNRFLGASPFMTALASLSILFVTFGIVGMGVGLGAIFPRFQYENVTQIAGSSGGLVYMISATTFVALVLFLEGVPAYFYLQSKLQGIPLRGGQIGFMIVAFGAVIALNVAAVVLPMRWGERSLEAREG